MFMKKRIMAVLTAVLLFIMAPASALGLSIVPPTPPTGDTTNLVLWLILGGAAVLLLLIVIILLARRRKKGGDDEPSASDIMPDNGLAEATENATQIPQEDPNDPNAF